MMSLGPATYLEVIAHDRASIEPERGVLFRLDRLTEPTLLTWALRSECIEEAAASATEAGVRLGPVEAGSRQRSDGTVLSWKLTDPYAMPLDGAVPFLIDWGETPHPAHTAPRAGDLVGLRFEHPEPARVREALGSLGMPLDVRDGERFRLIAAIRTADGVRELS